MRAIIPVVIVLCIFTGCENPITFVWDVRVETDAAQYSFPEPVIMTVDNKSENTVDIRICNEGLYYSLQRRVGAAWDTVYTTDCPGEATFESLPVDQSRNFTIDISVLSGVEEISGTYRIEIVLYPVDDRRVRLPLNMRISNTFTVTDPDQGETT